MTNDVVLREVWELDLPIFFAHQLDPVANQMAAFPARDQAAFTAHWTRILHDPTVTTKTILFNGRVAGNIGSFELSGKPQVGYWIGRDYWGRGIATKALSLFLRHVKVRPLYAHVARHNVGSIRVLEKCGFMLCAEERGALDDTGEPFDELILKLRP
jgi:RimJ/RimL family protein N-acetyltransferase